MTGELEKRFLQDLNANMGIVHRICHIYFSRDKDEREDAFQEIMFQLWKSYPTFQGESKFSTWMYRVALNTAITGIRKAIRAPDRERLSEKYHQIPESIDAERFEERSSQLYEAIRSLSDIDKAIVLLYLEDSSYEEISNVTGLNVSTVGVRLVRAKKKLHERLKNIL